MYEQFAISLDYIKLKLFYHFKLSEKQILKFRENKIFVVTVKTSADSDTEQIE